MGGVFCYVKRIVAMRIMLKTIVTTFLIPSLIEQRRYMSVKECFLYWFFQKVLRINSHVNWPVHWSSSVSFPERITLKSSLRPPGFAQGNYIQAINGIVIGENVWMAPGVQVISANHDLYDFNEHVPDRPIEIGDNCWLAANVVILPGVKLGNHVITAAGAVVTKSFPDNCLIGGVPAKLIKEIGPYRKGLIFNNQRDPGARSDGPAHGHAGAGASNGGKALPTAGSMSHARCRGSEGQ